MLVAGAACVLALLAVFAVELANTQATSRHSLEARVNERAELAAALLDSLFATVSQQIPTDARLYGGPTISPAVLQRQKQTNAFLAVFDSNGTVLGATSAFDAQARTNVQRANLVSVPLGSYRLSDVLPYGHTGVIAFSVAFPTSSGTRVLVSGFVPAALDAFTLGELRRIPGVPGSFSYLIDGRGTVLSSTNPQKRPFSQLSLPQGLAAAHPGALQSGSDYWDASGLANSSWRIVLVSPYGPLFASVTGARKWVPWLIFLALVLAALGTVALALRVVRAGQQLRVANDQLAVLNEELSASNGELELRARELTRSNEELEQFASIASHDLQEPLRKVRTFTSQLEVTEAERLSVKGLDYLQRTNRAAERMQLLIEDLLQFSRVGTHGRPFETVDLDAVLRDVLDDLSVTASAAGAQIEAGPLGTIDADPVQMRQLLQNLLSNALKFRKPDVAPLITIGGVREAGLLRITVRDNGIGFDPRYRQRIFRVFERLHGRSEYPGTGIGLALCRKIAERHGGSIVADGELGVGATLTVTLPLGKRRGRGGARSTEQPDHDRSAAHAAV